MVPPSSSTFASTPDPEIARQYLVDYLEEEFRRHPQIRVRRLPADENPENEGVPVKSESREYFFPFEWALPGRFGRVEALVRKIKEVI